MSGPRDSTGYEKDMFLLAVKIKDKEMLREIVIIRYPNVLWGNVTRELSQADRDWIDECLKRDPAEYDDDFNTW